MSRSCSVLHSLRHSLLGVLVAACGGEASPADAGHPADAGPCWPLEATPGGEIEIGTGDVDFEPLGDTLEIIRSAAQSDPFVQIHARMRGLPAGNPDDIFDPANPKTKARVEIESLGLTLGVDCPATIGYTAAPAAGAFDLAHSLHVGFGVMPVDQAPGAQGRVILEVVGSNGRYAKAEKLVTLTRSAAPP